LSTANLSYNNIPSADMEVVGQIFPDSCTGNSIYRVCWLTIVDEKDHLIFQDEVVRDALGKIFAILASNDLTVLMWAMCQSYLLICRVILKCNAIDGLYKGSAIG